MMNIRSTEYVLLMCVRTTWVLATATSRSWQWLRTAFTHHADPLLIIEHGSILEGKKEGGDEE